MTQDQNKKTLRHFQCRDYLWEIFEQMSAELECSTDYLINEAMRQYARSRNYGTSQRAAAPQAPAKPAAPAAPAAPAPPSGGGGGIPSLRSAGPGRPTVPAPPGSRPRRAPAPPAPKRPSSMPPPPRSRTGQQPPPRMPAVSSAPPPLPGGGRAAAPAAVAASQLFIIFNGQKIPVSKEEFVIGRGTKSADLAIKDGNISRRHAAVVFHNGAHFMKDLGSTNGVEFQGRRFDSKRIEEGDVFRLCDYEIQFTYA